MENANLHKNPSKTSESRRAFYFHKIFQKIQVK